MRILEEMIVFLSCDKDVEGDPANVDVSLRVPMLADKKVKDLAKLLAGVARPWNVVVAGQQEGLVLGTVSRWRRRICRRSRGKVLDGISGTGSEGILS